MFAAESNDEGSLSNAYAASNSAFARSSIALITTETPLITTETSLITTETSLITKHLRTPRVVLVVCFERRSAHLARKPRRRLNTLRPHTLRMCIVGAVVARIETRAHLGHRERLVGREREDGVESFARHLALARVPLGLVNRRLRHTVPRVKS